jgi:hypothetical protein
MGRGWAEAAPQGSGRSGARVLSGRGAAGSLDRPTGRQDKYDDEEGEGRDGDKNRNWNKDKGDDDI